MDVFSLEPGRPPQAVSAAVRGEIDLATADDLLLRLLMLAGAASGEITLDLAQVTFIDCSGLRALIALDRHVRTAGGRVRVTARSAPVARLFELVRPYVDCHDLLAPPAPAATHRAPPRTTLWQRYRWQGCETVRRDLAHGTGMPWRT